MCAARAVGCDCGRAAVRLRGGRMLRAWRSIAASVRASRHAAQPTRSAGSPNVLEAPDTTTAVAESSTKLGFTPLPSKLMPR